MAAKDVNRQEQRKTMMLNEPMSKVIPKMAIPTIIAFLINSVYSLADTYFVSSLGTNATAAVSVNSSLDQLIMMAGSMLAVGANSYIARLLGGGNDKKASQVLSTSFFTAAALGTLLMVFGSIFMTPMVRLLGATLCASCGTVHGLQLCYEPVPAVRGQRDALHDWNGFWRCAQLHS